MKHRYDFSQKKPVKQDESRKILCKIYFIFFRYPFVKNMMENVYKIKILKRDKNSRHEGEDESGKFAIRMKKNW